MPAPAPALPPVAVQVAMISLGLGSTMLLTFLMGLCSPTSHCHQQSNSFRGFIQQSTSAPWQVCLQL